MANPIYPDLDNKFPSQIDNFDRFEDVTLNMVSAVNKYYEYYNAGDLASAKGVLDANPTLKRMIINADALNKLRDAVVSIERYYNDNIYDYIIEKSGQIPVNPTSTTGLNIWIET